MVEGWHEADYFSREKNKNHVLMSGTLVSPDFFLFSLHLLFFLHLTLFLLFVFVLFCFCQRVNRVQKHLFGFFFKIWLPCLLHQRATFSGATTSNGGQNCDWWIMSSLHTFLLLKNNNTVITHYLHRLTFSLFILVCVNIYPESKGAKYRKQFKARVCLIVTFCFNVDNLFLLE